MKEQEHLCNLGSLLPNETVQFYDPKSKTIHESKLFDHAHDRTILFFYPADFSFVCPTELHALNENYKILKKYNTQVYVISRDSVYTHKQRIDHDERLAHFNIKMISDREGNLGKQFQIINEKTKDFQRATIIVNKAGYVQSFEVLPEKLGRNVEEIVRKIKAFNYIREHPHCMCPEHREEGEKSIGEESLPNEKKNMFISNT